MPKALRARYVPPALPAGITLAVTILFIGFTFTRGLSYVSGEPGVLLELRGHGALNLTVFGCFLMVGAATFVTMVIARLHFGVWCAHVFLICTYFGVSVTMLGGVLERGSGYDAVLAPVGGLVWHAILSRTMRPFPPHEALRDTRR